MSQMTVQQALETMARCHRAGQFGQAETLCRQILAVAPNVAAFHFNLARILNDQRKAAEAVSAYQQAVRLEPAFPDGFRSLGALLWSMGRLNEALEALQKAIQYHPDDFAALGTLGGLLNDLERPTDALPLFDRAILLQPQVGALYYNRGTAHYKLENLSSAVADYRRAIALQPDHAMAHSHLGNALRKQQELPEALREFEAAIALDGQLVVAIVAAGQMLRAQGRADEAVTLLTKANETNRDSPECLNELGNSLLATGEFANAIIHFERSIALRPEFPDAHLDLSMALLTLGDIPRGWREYQWRWKVPGLYAKADPPASQYWEGQPLQGKSILLCAEQGFGDTFQFVRYAQVLHDMGARVILWCQPGLVALMNQCPGIDQVVSNTEPFPTTDFYSPLMDLPFQLKTDLQSIPNRTPYLAAPTDRITRWQSLVGLRTAKLRVGLVWSGNPLHQRDSERSIPLEFFAPLAEMSGVEFVSLQKGPAEATSGGVPWLDARFTPDLHDFSDTAALIAQLDLVIAVDTSIVHLAGAMGKPVWVMVTFVPDWRWFLDRQDSPWYPTMRIFRQRRRDDWSSVIADVVIALKTQVLCQT